MPFGKHRGEELDQIPEDYLIWVLEKADRASPLLKMAIRRVLGLPPADDPFGSDYYSPPPPPPPPPPPRKGMVAKQELESALRSYFRRLAMKHHPDRGGSNDRMAVVNEVMNDVLRMLATQAEK